MKLRNALAIGLCLLCGIASPQVGPRGNRVCLVLGGGSALGWAHVGILKAFEEHRIPVDCIVGTSAGGLVAGLVAAGMRPNEIEQLIASVPWDDIFTGRPAYNDLPWRRKEDRRDLPIRFEFGLRGNELRLPGGLDPAQQVGLLISRVAIGASPMGKGAPIRNFDDLVIPFRCVAADLNSGLQKTLGTGSLYQALRATMAIPVNFTPVVRGDEVLVDGGLLDNVPIDVAKAEFDPQFIFAVKLSGLSGSAAGQESLADILTRSIAVVGEDQFRSREAKADLLFTPELSEFSGLDYAKAEQLVRAGYRQAEEAFRSGAFAKLEKFALDEQSWAAYQNQLDQRRARLNVEPRPTFITAVTTRVTEDRSASGRRKAGELWIKATETSGEPEEQLSSRLSRFLGKDLSLADVAKDLSGELNKIVGEGRYESIAYEMTANDEGAQGLLLRVKEKTYAPPFANFGTDLVTFENNNTRFALKSRLTFVDKSGNGTEGRVDLGLGYRNALAFEYYKPVIHRSLFVAPRAYYSRGQESLFNGGVERTTYRSEVYGLGFDLGAPLGRQGELRIGYDFGRQNNQVSVGQPSTGVDSGVTSAVRLRYRYDDQNGDLIPLKGIRTEIDGRYFFDAPGGSRQFASASARISAFSQLSPNHSLFVVGEGGTTFGVDAPTLTQFSIGGPLRLGAYDFGELRGDNYLYGSIGMIRKLAKLPDVVGGKLFAVGWLEIGGVGPARRALHIRESASFGIMVETILGPVFLGGSLGDSGHRALYFTLGRGF